MSMLLDTGADISLISRAHLSEHQKQHIQPTSKVEPKSCVRQCGQDGGCATDDGSDG